ncbi:hypothetical protein ACU42Y_05450 [Proteus mirabilis]
MSRYQNNQISVAVHEGIVEVKATEKSLRLTYMLALKQLANQLIINLSFPQSMLIL